MSWLFHKLWTYISPKQMINKIGNFIKRIRFTAAHINCSCKTIFNRRQNGLYHIVNVNKISALCSVSKNIWSRILSYILHRESNDAGNSSLMRPSGAIPNKILNPTARAPVIRNLLFENFKPVSLRHLRARLLCLSLFSFEFE